MRSAIVGVSIGMALWGSTITARADIPAPKPPKGVPIMLEVDDQLVETRLVIPRGLLPRAAQRGEGGAIGFDPRTIVAGLALSLATVLGGLLLFRRHFARPKLVATAASLACLTTAGLLWANAPPPPPQPQPDDTNGLGSRVVIEIVEEGDVVRYYAPTQLYVDLAEVAQRNAAPAAAPAPSSTK